MPDSPSEYAEQIDRIANGYREAQLLLCANRLGLFPRLVQGPLSAGEIARALEASERGVQILCDALVAMSLLEKKGDRYENSDMARQCLLPSSPAAKTGILLHGARLYERWGTLYRVIKTGQPSPEEALDPDLRFDETVFARAMADSARFMVEKTVGQLDLTGFRRLLDVGGGPGLYSIEFARANPDLHAVILDNEKTLQVARANIREAGLEERVTGLPGDALGDRLGGPYDFVFVSNVIHQYSPPENRKLVFRCGEVLEPGGRLCIKDFLLDPGRTTPVGAALFAVNMLVNTEQGNCYTTEEVRTWLEAAGLSFIEHRVLTPQSGVIIGQKRSG